MRRGLMGRYPRRKSRVFDLDQSPDSLIFRRKCVSQYPRRRVDDRGETLDLIGVIAAFVAFSAMLGYAQITSGGPGR